MQLRLALSDTLVSHASSEWVLGATVQVVLELMPKSHRVSAERGVLRKLVRTKLLAWAKLVLQDVEGEAG